MFQKIAKHRANDASNDVHRPPLVEIENCSGKDMSTGDYTRTLLTLRIRIMRTLRAKSGPERPTVQWERCDEEPVASNINLGGRFRRGIFAGKRVYI